jgi:hypothetical protein
MAAISSRGNAYTGFQRNHYLEIARIFCLHREEVGSQLANLQIHLRPAAQAWVRDRNLSRLPENASFS